MSLARRSNNGGSHTELAEYHGEDAPFLEPPTAIQAITRAEIDLQVATAKQYPRSITRFMSEAKTLVAMDPKLAEQCTYVLPARRGGQSNEPITGPSARLAEIVSFCWGNLSVAARIIEDDGKFITAQAVAIDAERNNRRVVEVKRGVTTRDGRRYGDDMIRVTAQAAMSIAKRNVTFEVIPRSFVNMIQDEAQRVARGDIKTLGERTHQTLAGLAAKGVSAERVFAALGIAGHEEITLDLLARLKGYWTAVKEGSTTLDEVFPPILSHGATPHAATADVNLVGESRAEAVTRAMGDVAGVQPQPQPQPQPTVTHGKGKRTAPAPEPPKAPEGDDEAARREYGPGADG